MARRLSGSTLLLGVVFPALSSIVPPALCAQDAPYTLRTGSRIVLLDVTATDRNGNPVRDLPRTAFHITDTKSPQDIRSFEEHTPENAPATTLPQHAPGTYSNDFVEHVPPAVNILLLDISNLGVEDQMFLAYEMRRFINSLPAADDGHVQQPLAVYTRSSGSVVLLQNFTTDRALLQSAASRALVRLFQPDPYRDDLATLHEIAGTLSQIPGRKNLLWYSGGTRVSFDLQAMVTQPAVQRSNAVVRQVYDELEAGRIAVFPIDARGLTVASNPGDFFQHSVMNEVADATGGHAFYNTNGLAAAASRVLGDDGFFYTLTYSPSNYKPDHRFHPVHVTVDRPDIKLSYRAGYFSDNPLPNGNAQPKPETRSRLLADGSMLRGETPPAGGPVIFTAEVHPAGDPALARDPRPIAELNPAAESAKGSIPYSIRYTVPAGSFSVQSVHGKPAIVLGVAAIAVNLNGTAVARTAQKLTLNINPDHLPLAPGVQLPLEQQLALKHGDFALYLAVWDATSGRIGSLQIPLQVPRQQAQQSPVKAPSPSPPTE